MKKYFSLFIIGITAFITSCSGVYSAQTTAIPEANSHKGEIYTKHCGSCHAVPHPKRLTFEGWKGLLPVMEMRIKEKGMNKLKDDDRKLILLYLKTHAQ